MEAVSNQDSATKSQELHKTETNPQSFDKGSERNVWMIVSMILFSLLIITTSSAVYFYTKYKNESDSLQVKIKSEEMMLSTTPTLTPTPTPADYFFDDTKISINYFPVKYNTYSKQQQKVAQTFTQNKITTVQAVVLKASFGVGNKVSLSIHKAGNVDDFTDGELIARGDYEAENIIKQNKLEIILDKPVQLDANVEYALVVSVDDFETQTSIAFSENDIFSNGKMYKYTRLIGGNGEIIRNNHSWQPENSQDVLYLLKDI